MLQYIIFSVFICAIHGKSVYRDNTNNTAVLISRYAKVSHYGQNDTQNIQQGRSNSGQSLWTHRFVVVVNLIYIIIIFYLIFTDQMPLLPVVKI